MKTVRGQLGELVTIETIALPASTTGKALQRRKTSCVVLDSRRMHSNPELGGERENATAVTWVAQRSPALVVSIRVF